MSEPPSATDGSSTVGPNIPRLFLASQSPQRSKLLRDAGYAFDVDPADVDEESYSREMLPSAVVVYLAKLKLNAVAQRHPEDVVLAADTIVAFGDTILGKPADADHARRMLRLLAGTTHVVVTGVAVARIVTGFQRADRVMTAIRMRELSDKEIDQFVQTGAWQGKAGGYGIQDADHHAGVFPAGTHPFLQRIDGCQSNVIGLPMTLTARFLEAAGVYPQ